MSTYYNLTHIDVFRKPIARVIGLICPIWDMGYLHYRSDEYHESSLPFTISTTYVTAHVFFHLAMGAIDGANIVSCSEPNRLLYVAVSGLEAFLWNIMATAVFPYFVGDVVFRTTKSLMVKRTEEGAPMTMMRNFPVYMAELSIPIIAWFFTDRLADILIGLIGLKSRVPCPDGIRMDRFRLA